MSKLPAANAAREGEARLPAGPTANQRSRKSNHSSADEKWKRVLRLFVDGRKRTRFDAELHGDHVLNTSVSQIGKRGVHFSREPVVIEGRFGKVHCKQYWLESPEIAKALRLLGVKP